ncbi:MAG TPA: hypothetical protein VE732_04500, partial [Nitrososphaera sp.]|nr:hypothetical protein [Nitrososphaera sp.]
MDIKALLFSFLLGIPASLLASWIFIRWRENVGNRHLRKILNFGKDDVIFVFSHRDLPKAILPRTATEDFMAMNNVIRALMLRGWKGPIRVRDTKRISEGDKSKNLVTVCAPKTNSFTGEVLERLKVDGRSLFEFQRTSDNPERWHIVLRGVAQYPSSSYEQEAAAKIEGKDVSEQELKDVAIIAKITNPW